MKVKKASELIKWCEDHDYVWSSYGMISTTKKGPPLYFGILLTSGKEQDKSYRYHEEWLEE